MALLPSHPCAKVVIVDQLVRRTDLYPAEMPPYQFPMEGVNLSADIKLQSSPLVSLPVEV